MTKKEMARQGRPQWEFVIRIDGRRIVEIHVGTKECFQNHILP
jgi:hypothetical protein